MENMEKSCVNVAWFRSLCAPQHPPARKCAGIAHHYASDLIGGQEDSLQPPASCRHVPCVLAQCRTSHVCPNQFDREPVLTPPLLASEHSSAPACSYFCSETWAWRPASAWPARVEFRDDPQKQPGALAEDESSVTRKQKPQPQTLNRRKLR